MSLNLTLAQQAKEFEKLWAAIPEGGTQKGFEMFKFCFEVDYNGKIDGHKNIYSNMWNFLNRKIGEGLGYKSYVDGRKSTAFIRMDSAGDLNLVQKTILVWNQNVGKDMGKQEITKHAMDGWGMNGDPSYVGTVFNSICDEGHGTRHKEGRAVCYGIDTEAPIELADKILEQKRNKTSD